MEKSYRRYIAGRKNAIRRSPSEEQEEILKQKSTDNQSIQQITRGKSISSGGVMQLQRTIGNQATIRLIQRVGQDSEEEDAERHPPPPSSDHEEEPPLPPPDFVEGPEDQLAPNADHTKKGHTGVFDAESFRKITEVQKSPIYLIRSILKKPLNRDQIKQACRGKTTGLSIRSDKAGKATSTLGSIPGLGMISKAIDFGRSSKKAFDAGQYKWQLAGMLHNIAINEKLSNPHYGLETTSEDGLETISRDEIMDEINAKESFFKHNKPDKQDVSRLKYLKKTLLIKDLTDLNSARSSRTKRALVGKALGIGIPFVSSIPTAPDKIVDFKNRENIENQTIDNVVTLFENLWDLPLNTFAKRFVERYEEVELLFEATGVDIKELGELAKEARGRQSGYYDVVKLVYFAMKNRG